MIVGISGDDARWLNHEEVVALVRNAGDSLALRLVTPMDNKVSCYTVIIKLLMKMKTAFNLKIL